MDSEGDSVNLSNVCKKDAYDLEAEMYPQALDFLPDKLGISGTIGFARELNLSYRRADLALLPLEFPAITNPLLSEFRNLTHSDLWSLSVVAWVSSITETGKEDVNLLQAYMKGVESHLPVLADTLGIKEIEPFAREIWKEFISSAGPLLIVELKLEKWREALRQATFYLDMAEASCVVLSKSAIHAVNISLFQEAGIGLFIAGVDTFDRVLYPKTIDQARDPRPIFQKMRALTDLSSTAPTKWKILER